ncbi:hypothetical protein AB0C27_47580 [Nonomuraea sp. NPDC048882]|uniref:hypothetical protein n=1 Tax=unclassified Nonomuraea TaxID=2593643 RepID=UPI0033F81C85
MDDLTKIETIGTKIATRLAGVGVTSYKELADHSAAELISLLPGVAGLTRDRVEGWRRDALRLTETAPAEVSDGGGSGQHDESYVIRVLVNERDGSIRATTMEHVGTGAEDRWPGWDPGRVLAFIGEHVKEEPAASSEPAPGARVKPIMGAVAHLGLGTRALPALRPFTVTVTLDLREAGALVYDVVLAARLLDGGGKSVLASESGSLEPGERSLSVTAQAPPPGRYRLDAAVSLRRAGENEIAGLAAAVENLPIDVLPG